MPFGSVIYAQEKEIIIHYKRHDNNYEGWNLWVWPDGQDGHEVEFTQEDEYGKIAIIRINAPGDVGFIVKRVEGDNIWADKDVSEDRFIDQFNENGPTELWLMEQDPDISYQELDGTISDKFKDLQITDMRVVKLVTTTDFTQEEADQIKASQGTIEKIVAGTDTTAAIYFKEDLNLKEELIIDFGRYGHQAARLGSVLHSKSFNDLYYYDGPLGYEYTKEQTTFRLWAPTAKYVDLKLEDILYPMTQKDRGVWETVVDGDQHLKKYTYELEFLGGQKSSSVDPYSFSVTANGQETVIATPDDLKPEGWDESKRMKSFGDYSEAIIYEAHVRDLTIHPDNGIEHKGKFLGLTEKGTKTRSGNPSGLDYIKSLGVTHVQFLPIYDFASIDETGDLSYGKTYNWGYDPHNYNVPEGSYSTNPLDPTLRAKELKQMIQAFHDEGLYVIMDVVYNHVFDVNRSPFHKTVPGYYFRFDNNGKLKNGTGVGNETASEQPMFRRYMIESTKYWIQEYNLDGFRFDLMGIHDIETMKQIREAINEIDPSIIILGEGWDMGTMASNLKANQKNAKSLPEIAYFNDSFRDAVKGSVFEASEPGFVNGAKSKERLLINNILGGEKLDDSMATYVNANQLVQYVEAHDNLTLFDKLMATNPNDSKETREKRHNLATTMVFLSNGMPFIHAGQETLRTKDGDHNSYISSDDINVFDYDRVSEYPNSLTLFKYLTSLRKEQPLLRLNQYEELNASSNVLVAENQLIAYELFDDNHKLVIAYNASEESRTITFDEGTYKTLLDGSNLDQREFENVSSYEVGPLSALVLMSGQISAQSSFNPILLGLILLLVLVILGWVYLRTKKQQSKN